MEDQEALKQLFGHINSLPHNQKTALILKAIEGLSQKEIAVILDVSIKSVESLLSRAKENLKKSRCYRRIAVFMSSKLLIMEKNKDLQALKRIKKVETPPFLYTRIEQKIRNLQSDKISWRWVLSGSLSFCLLLYFNISLIHSNLNKEVSANDLELVIEDMNLASSIPLYYE